MLPNIVGIIMDYHDPWEILFIGLWTLLSKRLYPRDTLIFAGEVLISVRFSKFFSSNETPMDRVAR